jgi:hypothetical protein
VNSDYSIRGGADSPLGRTLHHGPHIGDGDYASLAGGNSFPIEKLKPTGQLETTRYA